MDTTQHNNGDFQTAVSEAVTVAVKRIESEMFMERRRHLLSELAFLENRLIQYGELRYRTKQPSHRRDE